MKVLWISNIIFPELCNKIGIPAPVVGGWMQACAKALLDKNGKLTLGVVSFYNGNNIQIFRDSEIQYYLVPEKQADRKKTPESLEEVPKLCSSLREAVAAYEEKLIWQALEATHGNISEAARILDVPRQTLQRKASQLRGEKAKEKQEKEI